MLIANVRVAGHCGVVDVRCALGRIAGVGPSLARLAGEHVIDGAGAALLPGLHDHHIHLYALAAQYESVQCGPPAVSDRLQFARALREDPGAGWVRGVGYHESVAGELDRWMLDRVLPDRPLKVQHRSGKLWVVNSLAAEILSLDQHAGLPGVALDDRGKPNGRLFRLDDWMREQLSRASMPSLAGVSRLLASYGVTGVTDATPGSDAIAVREFTRAASSGEWLQNVRVMGADALPASGCDRVQCAERKVMLDADALPDWEALCAIFSRAHQQGRAVAVHCVTPAELVLALAALRAVGPVDGDRIEHASLVPESVLPLLREVGVRVVTQPGFVHERGDQYAAAVDAVEHSELYRCAALLARGIRVAGSTDAPFGDPDPWRAMRAAVLRRSRAGILLGRAERLTPEQALALFTSAADDPGGPSRTVAVGEVAELCLLDCTWEVARLCLCSDAVKATISNGELIYMRGQPQQQVGQHASAVA